MPHSPAHAPLLVPATKREFPCPLRQPPFTHSRPCVYSRVLWSHASWLIARAVTASCAHRHQPIDGSFGLGVRLVTQPKEGLHQHRRDASLSSVDSEADEWALAEQQLIALQARFGC